MRRLADILAGIKIFKYLDSRVFFELLKSFSTTTFAAGETVFDGRGNGISEGDLVIVISGHVDLYVKESIGEDDGSGSMSGWATPSLSKKGRSRTSSSEVALHHHSMESDPYPDALLDCLDREEELSGSRRFHSFKPRKEKEMGRGTLLKTLGPGSTVSSLFEILAVFGEQIDHKDSKDSLVDTGTAEGAKSATGLGLFDGQPSVPSVSVEDHDSPTEQEHQRNSNESLKRARKLLPLLTAVAKTSAAVAVLPASALAALPPQAKSTLIHVVLSRFQRTVGVVYDYLGVEEEAWGVMRALNQVPCFGPLLSLPYTIMDKLRAAMPLTQAGRPVMQSLRGRPRSFPAANSSPGRRAKFDVEEERDEVDEGERAVSNLLGSLSKLPSVPVPTTGSGNSSTEFKPARSSSVSELTASDIRATKAAAISALCQTLGAPDAQEMVDDAEVFSVSAGVVLLRQGKRPPGLYFVVEGEFEVTTSLDRATARRYETPRTSESDLHDTGNADASIWDPAKLYGSNERRHISFLERPLNSLGREMTEDSMDERAPAPGLAQLAALARTGGKRVLGTLGPGCLLGYVALLTGYPSLSNVSATTSATVVFVPRGVVDKLVSQHPKTLSWLSARLLGLPRLSLYVDLAMDWMQCRASQIVCRQGDKASAIYVVFSGRLRSIVERQTNADLSGVAWANNEKSTYPRSSGALWATLFESSSGLNGHDEDEDEDHQNTGLAGSIRQLIFAGLGTKPNKRRKSKSSSSQKVRRAVNFEVLREYGQGESFGEVEVVMDRPFPATVHAIRDTEVAVIPTSLYNALAAKRPEVMLQLSRIIAASASKPGNTPRPSVFPMTTTFSPDPGLSNSNLKTVAILPVNRHVPVQEFAERLRDALRIEGASAAVLNTAAVLSVLGKHAFTRFGKLKLTNWLAEQEDLSRMVLYVADSQPNSPWTQRCIRQADAILVVGIGDDSSAPGEYERLLDLTTARKDLVLLHNERHVIQGSTAEWLKKRPWVAAHHHVQMHVPHRNGLAGRSPTASPNSIFDEFTRLLRPASTITSRTLPPRPIFARLKSYDHFEPSLLAAAAQVDVQSHQITSDFRRIARRLLAKSVGLVLGGGGARGLAHVGAIKAFEEAGIEFDIIGGTSQGAFIGGILAREGNSVAVFARSKFFASRMSSTMSYLMDLTYPGIAWFTGHEFNRTVWKTFSVCRCSTHWSNRLTRFSPPGHSHRRYVDQFLLHCC